MAALEGFVADIVDLCSALSELFALEALLLSDAERAETVELLRDLSQCMSKGERLSLCLESRIRELELSPLVTSGEFVLLPVHPCVNSN